MKDYFITYADGKGKIKNIVINDQSKKQAENTVTKVIPNLTVKSVVELNQVKC